MTVPHHFYFKHKSYILLHVCIDYMCFLLVFYFCDFISCDFFPVTFFRDFISCDFFPVTFFRDFISVTFFL